MDYSAANDRNKQATRIDAITGRFDPVLLALCIALVAIGIVMVASASLALGETMGVGELYFLNRHLIFVALGVAIAAAVMHVELKLIEQYHDLILMAAFVLLMIVFIPGIGVTVNGARRWINVLVANFQVVEVVKLLMIIWMASYLVRNRDQLADQWQVLLKPLGVMMALVCLLLLQPDFGSAVLLIGVGAAMLFLAGASLKRLALMGLPAMMVMGLVAVLEPYRVARLTNFRDPWQDPFDGGYQLVQALIAIGRGGWTGVGLGGSVQKLQAFPEVHTDFIFSVFAEEAGFIGVIVLVALYAAFAWRAFSIGRRCFDLRRHFAALLSFGITVWVIMQATISIGVNLGLLPTKGLTLPLISYGGSSVLLVFTAMGLLLRVSFELVRAERQVAKARGIDEILSDTAPLVEQANVSTAPAGSIKKHQVRVEPKWGVM